MQTTAKRYSFILSTALALAAAGCATISDCSYELTQKIRTQKSWERYDTGCVCYSLAYRNGWKAGHYDVLTGGDGCPPIFAPECYSNPLKIIFHCDEPRHDWYLGFQDGAASAHQSPDTHYLKPWLPPALCQPVCQSCPTQPMLPMESEAVPFQLDTPYVSESPQEEQISQEAVPLDMKLEPEPGPAPAELTPTPTPAPQPAPSAAAPAPAATPEPGAATAPAPAPPESASLSTSAPREPAPSPATEPSPASTPQLTPSTSEPTSFDSTHLHPDRLAQLLVLRKKQDVGFDVEFKPSPIPPALPGGSNVRTIGFERSSIAPQVRQPKSIVPEYLNGPESRIDSMARAFQFES